uniref:Calmin n=1 Tax=Salvator merianae TaxID=96440 RepID=A0A8D0BY14_SALMN
MAGNEWDWFQREELIGQISDIRVQNLQVERENVQKRTFTRWINLHLEKCSPPLEVKDLLVDIKDGKILMALLEVLSGQNLLHEYKPSTHRIFRLNNIAKALKFLEDSNIKELTGNLNRNSSSSSLSSGPSGPDSDTSHPSTPNVERSMSVSVKDQRKAIKALLTWVQRKTRKYGVAVQDFASSWRSGLAFLAVIKAIDSSLVDMKQAFEKSPRENLEDAFALAQDHLGIPRLLEPEDIMVDSPDDQSIMTYVAQFLEHFPELEGEDFSDPDKEFPVETTHIHRVNETSGEEKLGKVAILNENGEHKFAAHVDRSQSSPSSIHIFKSSLEQGNQNFQITQNEQLNDKLQQPFSNHSEVLIEEKQRPSSLPIMQQDVLHSSSGTDLTASSTNGSEENELRMNNSLKPSNDSPPTAVMEHKHPDEPDEFSEVESEDLKVHKSTCDTDGSHNKSISHLAWASVPPENSSEHQAIPEQTKEVEYPVAVSQEETSVQRNILKMLHDEISNLPEKQKHANQASGIKEVYTPDEEMDGYDLKDTSEAFGSYEHLSSPVRNTPKSLDISHDDGSLDKMMPNTSKVSVIPHDLFYYPHYDVPISAVLDAFATADPDPSLSENNKICAELLVNCLAEKELLSLNMEEDIAKVGQHATEVPPKQENDSSLEKQKKDSQNHRKAPLDNVAVIGNSVITKANSNKESTPNNSAHSEVPMIVVNRIDTAAEERKVPEERSKRKEKRKNKAISQGENLPSAKSGTTRLLDKLEEESADYIGLSRVSHSDPNVVSQRSFPDSTSKESGSMDIQKSGTSSDSTSTSVRKRKDLERKETPEAAEPHSSPSRTEQPELFYFIFFLWVLVYCLLLLPQLVSSSLQSL